MKSLVALLFAVSLLISCEAQGSSAVTTVFVKKGDDLPLNVDDVPEDFILVEWTFNKTFDLARFAPGGKRSVLPDFTGRIEFPVRAFSVILKNLQEADSGVYAAQLTTLDKKKTLAEYKVTVQGPVSPVNLTVNKEVSRSSDSCNLTVSCSTQHSHINSTFRCVNRICSQEGGERPEVTTSDPVPVPVYVIVMIIIIILVIIIVPLVLFLYRRKRGNDIKESIENTVYETPQVQPPDQSPTDDASGLSPTSTYSLVGPHTGSLIPTETKGMTLPESLYAQV